MLMHFCVINLKMTAKIDDSTVWALCVCVRQRCAVKLLKLPAAPLLACGFMSLPRRCALSLQRFLGCSKSRLGFNG